MSKPKRVIALGFFDGVHLGHGALLRRVEEAADRLGAVPCAFTFDKSPTAVITGQNVPLLSTVDDRVRLMREGYGIQEVVVASFDAMQRMAWEDFVSKYLAEELGAVHVVAGHDFHFGYMGQGNPARLKERCAQLGRTLVAQGEMERAAQFLGHPHILTQQVGHGKGIGHSTLGFPTVNLRVPEGVIVPAFGVYAARVWVLPDYPDHRPRIPGGGPYTAVTNVGVRPTVEGFILDFDGDLYGRQIRMEFHKRLRGERKFPSMAALAEEIRRNADQARDYFGG